MRRPLPWLVFGGALTATVLAGRWGRSLFTTSEYVHFSVNFPTVAGHEQLDLQQVGGPWARLPQGEWLGYPSGGLLVWGQEGRLVVDLGRRGFIKSWVQPGTLLLSTHWLRNVGTEPRRVRLELGMCGFGVRWTTFEREWDESSRSFTRTILPGTTGNMDWVVQIPETHLRRPLVCAGRLEVFDADSGLLLTDFPVTIRNSSVTGADP